MYSSYKCVIHSSVELVWCGEFEGLRRVNTISCGAAVWRQADEKGIGDQKLWKKNILLKVFRLKMLLQEQSHTQLGETWVLSTLPFNHSGFLSWVNITEWKAVSGNTFNFLGGMNPTTDKICNFHLGVEILKLLGHQHYFSGRFISPISAQRQWLLPWCASRSIRVERSYAAAREQWML